MALVWKDFLKDINWGAAGASSRSLYETDLVRETVRRPAGNAEGGTRQSGDHHGKDGKGPKHQRSDESTGSDGMGWCHEHDSPSGGRDCFAGTDL